MESFAWDGNFLSMGSHNFSSFKYMSDLCLRTLKTYLFSTSFSIMSRTALRSCATPAWCSGLPMRSRTISINLHDSSKSMALQYFFKLRSVSCVLSHIPSESSPRRNEFLRDPHCIKAVVQSPQSNVLHLPQTHNPRAKRPAPAHCSAGTMGGGAQFAAETTAAVAGKESIALHRVHRTQLLPMTNLSSAGRRAGTRAAPRLCREKFFNLGSLDLLRPRVARDIRKAVGWVTEV